MKLPFHLSQVIILISGVLALACLPKESSNKKEVAFWLTTGDQTSLFAKQPSLSVGDSKPDAAVLLTVDTTQRYQGIDGFGYALTGGSAWAINQKLNAAQRDSLLRELFLTDGNNIGISYLRVSIGGSDLDDHVFTYDDLPKGKTDPELKHFNLSLDTVNLIPVLKEILAINPDIKIMGSPWTPPVWMKTNGLPKDGRLKTAYYDAYANYFAKYVQAMAKEGITIDAVTIQNEPENPKNTPSLLMNAQEQALFIKKHLGPAFQRAAIKTKIIVFDHNCDHPEYPISILNDTEAKPYIDGSAFHMYVGEIDALSKVHDAHPDKNIYFTEQWTSGNGEFAGDLNWHIKTLIIGATRNWSRTVLEWNLASDENFDPHTSDGGCDICQGALTIGESNNVTRKVSYYIIAHASKFVRPGSVRIQSNMIDGLPNVAFLTPEGKKVVIVLNEGKEAKSLAIQHKDKAVSISLAGGAVGTFIW